MRERDTGSVFLVSRVGIFFSGGRARNLLCAVCSSFSFLMAWRVRVQ